MNALLRIAEEENALRRTALEGRWPTGWQRGKQVKVRVSCWEVEALIDEVVEKQIPLSGNHSEGCANSFAGRAYWLTR